MQSVYLLAVRVLCGACLVLASSFIFVQVTTTASYAQASGTVSDSGPAPINVYEDGFSVAAFYTNLGPVPQQERADHAQSKIDQVFNDPKLDVAKFRYTNESVGARIYYDDIPLLLVSREDAIQARSGTAELAQDYVKRLQVAATEYKRDSRPTRIAFGVFCALLGLVALVFVVGKTGNICEAMANATVSWAGRNIHINTDMFGELIKLASTFVVRSIFFAVLIFCWYVYIFCCLDYFPWTKVYAAQLLSKTLGPVSQGTRAVTEYLPNLFLISFIAYIGYGVILFSKYVFAEIGRERLSLPDFDPDWAEPTFKLARALIVFMAVIVAAPYFPGWGSPAFNQFGLFLGLLVSLGSSGAISHLVAGVLLTYTRAFKLGDRVKIGTFTGDVISRTLFTTQLKTIKNEQVTLHNGQVITMEIINYTTLANSDGLILHTPVTIGYDVDWRQIHELLKSAALACDGIDSKPEPFVLQTALDDAYVVYEINAYTKKPHEMMRLYSDLRQSIQDKFFEAGVEIMSPHYTSLRDGNAVAIPDQYLKKGYRAPAFVISEKRDI
jgi:small-conductance mechanosensitive channel